MYCLQHLKSWVSRLWTSAERLPDPGKYEGNKASPKEDVKSGCSCSTEEICFTKCAVEIFPASQDFICVAARILQAVFVQYVLRIFKVWIVSLSCRYSFDIWGNLGAKSTFKHWIPSPEEAQASFVQLAALSPAPSKGQCHISTIFFVAT